MSEGPPTRGDGTPSYLLDTSVLIAPPAAPDGDGAVFVSVVSIGELHADVELARDPDARTVRVRRLATVLGTIPVLAVDAATAAHYGTLRRTAGRGPSNDLWIAATALARGLTVLTRDERLARLPGVPAELVA